MVRITTQLFESKKLLSYGFFYLLMSLAVFSAVMIDGARGAMTLIATVIGCVTMLYLVTHPKALVLVALIGITFSRLIERASGVGALTYTDEVLTIACVSVLVGGRLLRHQAPRNIPGGKVFGLFIIVGVVSAFIAGVDFALTMQGAFLTAKGLLLAWSVAQVDWSSEDLKRGCKILSGALIILLFSAAINFAVPQAWANLFQNLSYVDYRIAGLPSIIGLTTHPLDLGGLMLFGSIAVAAYRSQVNRTSFNGWLLAGTALVGVLTFRRTIMAAMATILGLEKIRQKGVAAIIAGLVLVPLVVTTVWDTIMELVNSAYVDYVENADKAARSILTLDSFDVAADHFPWGAGFARFGSYLAATNYSPEYLQRGYQAVWGMGPVPNGRFLTDTQWPAILGETGFIGAGLFACGMLLVAKHFWHLRLSEEAMTRWVGVSGLGIVGGAAIMSVASPVYTSSTFVGPLFCIIGIAASIRRPDLTKSQPRQGDPKVSRSTALL